MFMLPVGNEHVVPVGVAMPLAPKQHWSDCDTPAVYATVCQTDPEREDGFRRVLEVHGW